ncbi:DUF1963 domain-containing protein [Herbiconiux sp. L3-i23]|uniref:DUF1963 domain-containing protein n=1 Tax=Herbiconiux sp. L3-i23 TaxID=2905871 RepID=UPI0020744030|nr:DUF1963 domain-containing protein [Herbiconiux sp. L3-i23]
MLVEIARPAAYLGVEPASAGEPQGSRLGGQPWLAAETPWPTDEQGRPMQFVLQIAVDDIPSEWAGRPLRPASWPGDGLLALFVGMSASSFDIPHRVLLTSRSEGALREAPLSMEPTRLEVVFLDEVPSAALTVRPGWDLPRWASDEWAHLDEEVFEGEHDAVGYESLEGLLNPLSSADTIGRLFGHVAGVGADPREDIEGRPEGTAWQHLLTLDSSLRVDLTIADAGYLQVLAPEPFGAELRLTFASVETS